jgi:hypothetical protein
MQVWGGDALSSPPARFNEKGCMQVWGGDALSSLTKTWMWEIFLEGHIGWRWNHRFTMVKCNAWSMTSRLDVIINSMFFFFNGVANYLFLAPLFPQNSKTVSDFKPTLAGIFIWALYGFDKDVKFWSWDHSKSCPRVRSKVYNLI